VTVKGLGKGIPGPIVAHMFILASEKAVVAVLAFLDIDDQLPVIHLIVSSPAHFSI
jgi:hypothetical protein